jgi:hypothetical protein
MEMLSPEELERERTQGAIRTDFVLSAEIMAIAYATLAGQSLVTTVFSLLVVALAITAGVYGFVALILKADDVGVRLAKEKNPSSLKFVGQILIRTMPVLLPILSAIGTAAMLWVGGGIVLHSIPAAHHWIENLVQSLAAGGFLAWLMEATVSLLIGIAVGWLVVLVIQMVQSIRGK